MNLTSDFRNLKWQTQYGGHNILKSQRFSWNFELQCFWGRWLRICHQIFEIKNGASNMVDMKFWKLCDFRITLHSGISGSLITNFKLDFSNSTDFKLILMRYSVCFPFPLILYNVGLSNRYCKFFCFDFILLTFLSKLYSEIPTLYFTWEGTERLFRPSDLVLRMTTTNWISQELCIIYIAGSHYSKNNWIIMPDPSMNKWIALQATSGCLFRIFPCFMHYP